MGTQSSYGGPGDKTPLLPDWALQTPAPTEPEEAEGEGDGDGQDVKTEADEEKPTVSPAPLKQPRPWQSAGTRLGKSLSAGSGNRSDQYRKAARGYVKALGGSRRASRSAAAGRSATALLGSFLSGVARNGLEATLRSLKLASVIGKDPVIVFAAVIDAICPEGSTREDAAARHGVNDAMWQLYAELVEQQGSLDALKAMTEEQVQATLLASVSAYIFTRWLGDLGIRIEMKAVTAEEAVKMERQMKTYIQDSVKSDLGGRRALDIDWQKREGREIVEKIYQEAFSLIGGSS